MLERYKILHELGRGATGAVYAARDRQAGVTVALKRLDPALLPRSDPEFGKRFLKQAHAARRLKHANIARILEAGEAAGTVYVAMELLEGQSLRRILDTGPLPTARALRIAHDIASGLAHAHLEGVVHGGLRPSNIIVLPSGAAKITDFGIGQLGQTPTPEQARGEPVDHRSDLFSLGVLLYEMLTREKPGAGSPLPPSELNPQVAPALDALVLGMLAAEPAARPAGAPIVLAELQRLDESLGRTPPAEPEPAPANPKVRIADGEAVQNAIQLMEQESLRERASGARRGMFAVPALMLALFGLGVGGVMYASRTQQQPTPVAAAPVEAAQPAPQTQKVAARTPEPAVSVTPPPAPAPVIPAQKPATPEKPVAAAPAPAPEPVRAAPATPSVPKQQTASLPRPEPRVARVSAQPAPKASKQQQAAPARLVVAVSPAGDVYIDGKHRGKTPPLTTFDLEPGMYRVEVRRGSRKPFLTYVTVQPGEVRRIRHDFNAKPIRPPA